MKFSEMQPTKQRTPAWLADEDVTLITDIRALRENKGVSLQAFSDACGIGALTLSRTERGATPNLKNALRIAAFLEMTVEKIWRLKAKP